jgi:aminoglycoside phosphotransferase (APT) family kinase protein
VTTAPPTAAAEVIAREARLLVELRRRPLPRVDETLPRHVGTFDVDGMMASATSVVPGIPMRTSYHAFRHLARPDSVRGDFAAAQDWLIALHADSMAAAAPIALLDGVPGRIAARWPEDSRALDLAERLGRLDARLSSAGTPRTVVHGDFWAGNLLISRGTVTGVVDWAAAELSGEPLRDIARFVITYSLYLDRHTRPGRPVTGHPGLRADGWGAGIRYGMSGQGWYGQLVRDFVESALARLGAPSWLWRAALLAGLGEIAATADHADFAICHRDLLWQLISEAA